ncbi:MAG: type I methionyl aminopeptidase [Mucilaginibacter polytrichastri]|nr:type I methionyl aminopeptidase [Mucilaginibacter polytrichastri]
MSRVHYKTAEEIDLIRKSGELLSRTHGEVAKLIGPGIRTIDLDKRAEEYIRDNGGVPAFLNHQGFKYSLCISLNDQIVHGFPGKYELRDGDIVSIDCGVILNDFITDCAYTYPIGEVSEDLRSLLDVTKECLRRGVEAAAAGNRVGDVGYAVQSYAESFGYGVVRELVGHGVGKMLWEKPEVPNYGRRGNGVKLEEGMVIAIEPMINLGRAGVKFWDDGWTVSTVDKKPSAHFEQTIAIGKGKSEVLTSFEYVEEVLKEKSKK